MIKLYACGGCGANIAKKINNLDIDINYIDTSDSNIRSLKSDNIYILEGVDGAGKDRNKTYNYFKDIASDVIIRFKPSSTLNIVLSSLSGGSGSIIAPLITKELLEGGHNTIVIGIDSKNSIKEIDNTIKTLKTYQSISNVTGKAVSLFYIENNTRSESDQKALLFIDLLYMLLDKNITEEFDTTDLSNFINFNKVSENSPTVSVIEINANEVINPEKDTSIVSTILMTKDKESSIKPVIPDYLSVCVVKDQNYKEEDVRIDNVLGKLALIVKKLEEEIKELQDNRKINKFKNLEVNSSNNDGVVL